MSEAVPRGHERCPCGYSVMACQAVGGHAERLGALGRGPLDAF